MLELPYKSPLMSQWASKTSTEYGTWTSVTLSRADSQCLNNCYTQCKYWFEFEMLK